jgi:hypothetical protein
MVPSLEVELEDVSFTAPVAQNEFPKYGVPRRRPVIVIEGIEV